MFLSLLNGDEAAWACQSSVPESVEADVTYSTDGNKKEKQDTNPHMHPLHNIK